MTLATPAWRARSSRASLDLVFACAPRAARRRAPAPSSCPEGRWSARAIARIVGGSLCVALVMGLPAAAHAEDDDALALELAGESDDVDTAADDDTPSLTPVEVVGEREDPLAERAPAATVRQVDIERARRTGVRLSDALERVPGIVVRALGGPLQGGEVRMRGGQGEQVLVTLQGVRLNSLAAAQVDLATLPIALFGSVATRHGGGASTHGSGAEAGVVALAVPSQTAGGRASAGLGGDSLASAATHAQVAVDDGEWSGGAGLAYDHTEGAFDYVDGQGREHSRENADGDRVGAYLSGGWRSSDTRLDAIGFVSWLERGAPGPSEFPTRFRAARSEHVGSVVALRASHTGLAESADFALDLDAQVGVRVRSDGYQNPDGLLEADIETRTDEQVLEPRLELTGWTGEWGVARLTFDTQHGWLERARATAGQGLVPTLDARRSVLAATLAQEWWPIDAVTVHGAVRVDGVVDGDGGTAVVPTLGIAIRALAGVELRIEVERVFRRPSFDELYLFTELLRGDPTLEPETGIDAEVALRVSPHERFDVELAGWLTHYDDLLRFVPTTALTWQAQNLAGAEVLGAQIHAEWRALDALAFVAGYTFTDATLLSGPRDPLPGTARHLVQGGVEVSKPWRWPVGFDLDARWLSARPLDLFGNREAAPWLRLDAAVWWDVHREWTLAVRARNLLDVRDAVDALQQPLPGLSVGATLSWHTRWGAPPTPAPVAIRGAGSAAAPEPSGTP